MELNRFIEYIKALGFDNSELSTQEYSGKFYFGVNLCFEITAHEDKRLGYEGYYYKARIIVFNIMLITEILNIQYIDGVNEVIKATDSLFNYYPHSDVLDRYNKLKEGLLLSISRENKLDRVLGE